MLFENGSIRLHETKKTRKRRPSVIAQNGFLGQISEAWAQFIQIAGRGPQRISHNAGTSVFILSSVGGASDIIWVDGIRRASTLSLYPSALPQQPLISTLRWQRRFKSRPRLLPEGLPYREIEGHQR